MLSDHYRGGMSERLIVRIITVDPANSRMEAVGKDASVIQIGVSSSPALFRWPSEGEYWIIVRENGEWGLQEKLFDPNSKSLTTLAPGEAMVQAEKIWTPSGDHLVRRSELEAEINTLEGLIDDLKTGQAYTMSNFGADRTLNGASMTINEVATVLATLIQDLKTVGILS